MSSGEVFSLTTTMTAPLTEVVGDQYISNVYVGEHIAAWTMQCNGSRGTVTLTAPNYNYAQLVTYQLSGGVYDTSNYGLASGYATATTSVTTTGADLFVTVFTSDGEDTSASTVSGWTTRLNVNGNSVWDQPNIVSGAVAFPSISSGGNLGNAVVVAAFKTIPQAALSVATSTSLAFTATVSSTASLARPVTVADTVEDGVLNWSATSTQPWLTFTSSSGTLISISSTTTSFVINPTGLSVGIYNATATISDPNALGSPQNIPVNLTITATDVTPPVVTSFTIPTLSASTTVPVTAFTATDDIGVTEFLITETSSTPSLSNSNWTSSTPAFFIFGGSGTRTAYAWARDAAGNISQNISATIAVDSSPPSVPQSLSATSTFPSSVDLSWASSTDVIGVAGYQVFRNGIQIASSTGASYIDTGLTPSTTYSYNITAYNDASLVSGDSASANVTTLSDTTPPSVPAGLTAAATSSIEVVLSWTPSTDNVGVSGYQIFRNGVEVGTTTQTSYDDTGLGPNTTYSYSVAAYDVSGNVSAKSTDTSATTPLPTTWYIRSDGGTRYDANFLQGQCNGQADAPYPGSGVDQACAFNDVRYLWADGSYTLGNIFPGWGWVIKGGDTVIIRGGPWRVGASTSSASFSFGGIAGDPYASGAPSIPSGDALQPTKILGENYADPTAPYTQIFGGFAVGNVFDLGDSQYVDLESLELTDHAQCSRVGSPDPSGCSSTYPLSDYAGNGIVTNTSTANILLQNLNIHGFTGRGIIGPIGGTLTVNNVRIAYNGAAGWDFDDGNGTPSINDPTVNATGLTVQWNGCNEEYPIVDGHPVASCYDQNSGGYGDGIGTPNTTLNFTCNHCDFDHNTQDGFDLLHTSGSQIKIINSISYANMGQQWKLGSMKSVIFENNLTIGNCNRMSQPIAGAPSTYNTYLSLFCRAQGDQIAMGVNNAGTYVFKNNSFATYSATSFDVECGDHSGSCSTSTITFENNLMVGYSNLGYTGASNVGELPALWYFGPNGTGGYGSSGDSFTVNPFIASNHNIYYNMRSCPTESSSTCLDPQLINEPTGNGSTFTESELDNYNFHLSANSSAIGAGVYDPAVTSDYAGNVRLVPPSIGAYEYTSIPASFSIPTNATSLTVPITFINTGTVAGYFLSESSTTPSSTTPGWMNATPASYTFQQAGSSRTLYAWTEDSGGNISSLGSAAISFSYYSLSATNTVQMFVSPGIVSPATQSVTSTSAITFNYPVIITVGGANVNIPAGTSFTTAANSDFTQIVATTSVVTSDLPVNAGVLGAIQYGFATSTISLDKPITINISVGTSYNGGTFPVYRKDAGTSWTEITNCTISNGMCSFTTDTLSSFAVVVSTTTSSSSASVYVPTGGGSVSQPSVDTPPPLSIASTSTTSDMSIVQLRDLLASLVARLRVLLAEESSPTSFVFTRNLQFRDAGPDVRQLQQFLIAKPLGPAAQKLALHGTTTYFGILTLDALIELQQHAGIVPAAGYFGPITRAYVNAHD